MNDVQPESTEVFADVVDKPRSGRGGCFAGCLLSSIVFYVLSPPLAGIMMYQMASIGWESGAEVMEKIVVIVYLPLQWLYDHFEPVQSFYEWYTGLFEQWMTP